jgi:hypothetical protein
MPNEVNHSVNPEKLGQAFEADFAEAVLDAPAPWMDDMLRLGHQTGAPHHGQ